MIIAALLLTPNPVFGANYQPRLTKTADSHQAVSNRPGATEPSQRRAVPSIVVRALCWAYALKNNAYPPYVCAVANVEGGKGEVEFRTWLVGLYWLPMGIHKGRAKEKGWRADILDVNIEIGARSFSGIFTLAELKRRLRTYNTEFDKDPSYWRSICQAIKKYEKGVSL